MPGVLDAQGAGVHGGPTGGVEDGDLARGGALVGIEDVGERLFGRATGAEPGQPVGAVGDLGHRLGGDRADAGLEPRHHRAGAEEVRLHGDAELPRVGAPGDDRVGHAEARRSGSRVCSPVSSSSVRCQPQRSREHRVALVGPGGDELVAGLEPHVPAGPVEVAAAAQDREHVEAGLDVELQLGQR